MMNEFILLITWQDGSESWVRGNELACTEEVIRCKALDSRVQCHIFEGRERPFEIKTITRTSCTLKK